jgi:signal peptidase II
MSRGFLSQSEGFFGISFVCNPLLSWGIPLEGLLFWLGWSVALLGLFYLIFNFTYNWPLFLVLGGAISNFIDRIAFECVVDYFKVGSFPIFNLADVFIVGGVFIFIFKIFGFGRFLKRIFSNI